MRSNKRGQMSIWDILIWGMVVLVAAVIIIFGFRQIFGKETKAIGEQFKKCSEVPGQCKQTCDQGETAVLGLYEDCQPPMIACCKK